METTSIARVATLSFLLFLGIAICASEAKRLKRTNIVFYMYDWQNPTKEENITNIPIAGNPHKAWGILEFGSLMAIDDALTEEYDRKSPQVGRAHGIYVNSALDGSDLHLLFSLVFTNKKFNGSTLEIQGADRFYLTDREVSVVSGTGMFRMARGYATLRTAFLDIPNVNAIIRWNVSVFHH